MIRIFQHYYYLFDYYFIIVSLFILGKEVYSHNYKKNPESHGKKLGLIKPRYTLVTSTRRVKCPFLPHNQGILHVISKNNN